MIVELLLLLLFNHKSISSTKSRTSNMCGVLETITRSKILRMNIWENCEINSWLEWRGVMTTEGHHMAGNRRWTSLASFKDKERICPDHRAYKLWNIFPRNKKTEHRGESIDPGNSILARLSVGVNIFCQWSILVKTVYFVFPRDDNYNNKLWTTTWRQLQRLNRTSSIDTGACRIFLPGRLFFDT